MGDTKSRQRAPQHLDVPKEYKFTEEERQGVLAMAAVGVPLTQICASLQGGISYVTLMKYFGRDINRAKAQTSLQVGNSLLNKVKEGDTSACIFWAKTQMEWREPKEKEDNSSAINTILDILRAAKERASSISEQRQRFSIESNNL